MASDRKMRLVSLCVTVPTLVFLIWSVVRGSAELSMELVPLAILVALVELLPVPAWRGLQISMGLPLLLMIGMIFPPASASLVAFVSTFDPRELRGQVSLDRALFNRCQVALSILAASATFHAVADINTSGTAVLILGAVLASVADYLVNSGLVTAYVSIERRISPLKVVRDLRLGGLAEFLASYLGLGVLGLALAVLFLQVRWWALPAFLAPLIFARQMFVRSQALEEAHKELQQREQVLRTLSNAIAEERADERLQIAGYLHDDLAQVLFRLSLQVDVARKLLEKGEIDRVGDQLVLIGESKQETSKRIRALIRDLHRSPLGAKGLAEALESFTDEVGGSADVIFNRDIEEIALPAPIALLIFHIAREGVMNSLKHAQAENMWISVREIDEEIVLQLRDDGLGFDTDAPGPEGHFGMTMMRERAKVGGGTLDVVSAPGEGTTITVSFPVALLQTEDEDAEVDEDGMGEEGTAVPA